jgi:hypothetical protein
VLTVNVSRTERPSALPAVWAQVSGVRVLPASGVACDLLAGQPLDRAVAVGAPQLPQAHQLSRQAVAAQARAQRVRMAASYGTNGTTGFRGDGTTTAKQIVGGVSGAPPRGRPV